MHGMILNNASMQLGLDPIWHNPFLVIYFFLNVKWLYGAFDFKLKGNL